MHTSNGTFPEDIETRTHAHARTHTHARTHRNRENKEVRASGRRWIDKARREGNREGKRDGRKER